jgi:hypothetical protein
MFLLPLPAFRNLAGNELGTLDAVAFRGLSNLRTLTLRECDLSSIHEMAFQGKCGHRV